MGERRTWEFSGIRMDTRDWPLVVMDMPERAVPDAAVRGALARLELVVRQTPPATKFYPVVDLSRTMEVAPAGQRKYLAAWWARRRPLLGGCLLGSSIVAGSALLRGMLSAVFWLNKPATPTTVVSTRREGLLCGIRALEQTPLPLPAHLAGLRDRLMASPTRGAASWSR
jgi:hypothetical protein